MGELSDEELKNIEDSLNKYLDHLLALDFITEINETLPKENDFSLHFPAKKSDDAVAKEYLTLIPED